jgi:hypothetical protein
MVTRVAMDDLRSCAFALVADAGRGGTGGCAHVRVRLVYGGRHGGCTAGYGRVRLYGGCAADARLTEGWGTAEVRLRYG